MLSQTVEMTEFKFACIDGTACDDIREKLEKIGFINIKELRSTYFDLSAEIPSSKVHPLEELVEKIRVSTKHSITRMKIETPN